MKTVMTLMFALFAFGNLAKAEDAAAPVADKAAFALDFGAEVDYFGFDNGVTVITPTVGFNIFEKLDFSATLPVYNNSVETGIGDLNFGAEYSLLNGKCEFLGACCASLGVNAFVGVPLDGQFSSYNTTYTVGGDFGLGWSKFHYDQTLSYLFDSDGAVYVAPLGGFVDSAVFSAASTLSYSFTDDMSAGVVFDQTYGSDSGQFLTLGPCATYKVNDSVNFDFAIGFPVLQEDMPYGEADFTLSAGIGFAF